ncbi:MAG: hypothetical protein A2Y10_11080 [Planctomycetes bacterium GWF2_41_51]|nr:MAG: hypothetical protein A2Y10_11080 [Planctomycetes bacterium GWF2_41_51]HBG28408.1 hypothetical protein [Phycisphaerales bacterium]
MSEKQFNIETEMDDLRKELENFQQEKERVRAIVGKIGGVPTYHSKLANIIFIIVLVVSVIISLIGGEKIRSLMIEAAVIALSIKIIYMIHCQTKVNHFKLWMLSSIEWRLNEIMKLVRKSENNKT